jgi:GDPmannose 4,6-dehydratase
MLQQDKPDDFVLSTGEQYSVREFVERTFKLKGINIKWRGTGVNEEGYDENTEKVYIDVSSKYFRPTEVETLLGDSSKAREMLNWVPQITFDELVKRMVDEDCN